MFKRWVALLLFLLLLVGCSSGSGGGTFVWIDAPLNPTTLSEVHPITIEGHASSPEGVAQVEVWVNGTLVDTIHSPAMVDNLAKFESGFTPTGPGEYVVQVVASGVNGVISEPDNTTITIGEAVAAVPEPEEEVEQQPVEEEEQQPTDTPTPVPEDNSPVINYWADPADIEAGGCTTIYWEVTNVSKVEFGGREQAFTGSYYDCMCETQTYPMKITYEDSTTETFRVTINLSGVCPTEVPETPVDETPPPPPTPLKPVDGVELSCTSYVMLRWSEPSDPSGISEYRIQFERQPGDNNWQPVSGSVFTGISVTEKEMYVECGWYYRYRVRAVDGNGNLGDWSDWSYFTVSLA